MICLNLLLDDISHTLPALDSNSGLLQTGGLRERGVEDFVQLFKCSVLSLNVEEVDENSLESIPGDVKEVEPPFNIAETDWSSILVEERGNVYPAVVELARYT